MGWQKFFIDSTFESEEGNSWSKGRLDGMIGCSIAEKHYSISLFMGPGKYWQSDDFIADFQSGAAVSRCIKRRLEFYVESPLVCYIYQRSPSEMMISNQKSISKNEPDGIMIIDGEDVNRWLIIDILVENKINKIQFFTHPDKI